jgi:sugar-specific transcriptional regulator TrmB
MPASSKMAIEHLARFGFSQYEAKAYSALIAHESLTGYELSNMSGVPRSKIYEVLQQLMDRSVVIATEGKPVRYRAQRVDVLLKTLQGDMERSIEILREHLPQEGSRQDAYVWDIATPDDLLGRAREAIAEAKREILLYGHDRDIEKILPALEKASRRAGMKIAIVLLGDGELEVKAAIYRHKGHEEKRGEKGGRQLTLVVDDQSLLQGVITDRQTCRGVWTTSRPLIDVAGDFIRHDIYFWKIYGRLEKHIVREFGAGFEGLSEIFSGKP